MKKLSVLTVAACLALASPAFAQPIRSPLAAANVHHSVEHSKPKAKTTCRVERRSKIVHGKKVFTKIRICETSKSAHPAGHHK
ncbi:hypothetical protein SAMN05428963_105128 [Consotaella salsifontis]|uniref:Uncharacterized protein n=1 Tax=Consotaella salsifontis TaxID=1365950 RepID=A0A1T4QM61_9HYPH|nr:hypothetical protein SAMN05428963_105128 [Consotaella salsifontis]